MIKKPFRPKKRKYDHEESNKGIRNHHVRRNATTIKTLPDIVGIGEEIEFARAKPTKCFPLGADNDRRIDTGDILFARKGDLRLSKHPLVRSTLNSQCHEGARTNHDVLDSIVITGIAIEDIDYSKVKSNIDPNEGLSGQISGSHSIINRQTEVLPFGCVFKAHLYDFDKEDGKPPGEEWLKLANPGHSTSERLTLGIKRYDPTEMDSSIARAYLKNVVMVSTEPHKALPSNNVFKSIKKTPSRLELLALSKLHESHVTMAAWIRLLQLRNVVDIITPHKQRRKEVLEEIVEELLDPEASEPSDQQIVEKIRDARRRFKKIDEHRTDPRTGKNTKFFPDKNGLRSDSDPLERFMHYDEKKTEHEDERLWLYSEAGLIFPQRRYIDDPDAMPNQEWNIDYLHSVHTKLINKETMEGNALYSLYCWEPVDGESSISRYGNNESLEKQLEACMREGMERSQASINMIYHMSIDKNIGTCLETADPGKSFKADVRPARP